MLQSYLQRRRVEQQLGSTHDPSEDKQQAFICPAYVLHEPDIIHELALLVCNSTHVTTQQDVDFMTNCPAGDCIHIDARKILGNWADLTVACSW